MNYGAPPLLGAKLQQGELDALLTFWNFASRLEAEGFREAMSVAECGAALGLPVDLDLLGFVFHQEWAETNRGAIDGFVAAAGEAQARLAVDAGAWNALRPLMQLPPGPGGEAVFENLRRRFVAGIVHPGVAEQEQTAEQVLAVLGPDAGGPEPDAGRSRSAPSGTAAGESESTAATPRLPAGVFWAARG